MARKRYRGNGTVKTKETKYIQIMVEMFNEYASLYDQSGGKSNYDGAGEYNYKVSFKNILERLDGNEKMATAFIGHLNPTWKPKHGDVIGILFERSQTSYKRVLSTIPGSAFNIRWWVNANRENGYNITCGKIRSNLCMSKEVANASIAYLLFVGYIKRTCITGSYMVNQ